MMPQLKHRAWHALLQLAVLLSPALSDTPSSALAASQDGEDQRTMDGNVLRSAVQQHGEDHQRTMDGHVLRSAVQLQAAINMSIEAGSRGYTVEAGAYYFDDGAPLVIYRARNWWLRTSGVVQLWFRVTQQWRTGGVLIKECADVSIAGLAVDYDPPAHYQGEVVAIEGIGAASVSGERPGVAGAAGAAGVAACYRRMDVNVPECVRDSTTTLREYNRPTRTWTATSGVNCYPGAGGSIPPGPEPFPCCHNNETGAKTPTLVTLKACQVGCASDPLCSAIVTGPYSDTPPPPPPPPPKPQPMATALVRTDPGFPEPHEYIANHTVNKDPSDNYMNTPAIWPKHIGYGCNRTLGCPGHGAGVLQPFNASLNTSDNVFQLLASARVGDKVTISMRKGITWHVQNSSRVTTSNISIHGASLFGVSEFDGLGSHVYENVWLGRRRGAAAAGGAGSGDAGAGPELCGRTPGRLCFGILASNADAFHSSGCKHGPKLLNVTLSNNFDDFLNVHSRMQLLGDVLGPTELMILDPRLQVAEGVPNDTPYGAAETMPNARPGDVLQFHALNTFLPRGSATIASLERVHDLELIAKYGAAAVAATSGAPPYNMWPPMGGSVQPDVGQLCGAFAKAHGLPACASRVWKVTFTAPVPAGIEKFDIVSLKGWDNAGLEVRECQFFGGIDGVHSKSNGAVFAGNTLACTGFDVSPWQHYLEGPPHLKNMTVTNNTFTACGGHYGTYTVNCSGMNNGTNLPTYPRGDGFCNGVGGAGVMLPTTCDMASMHIKDNHGPSDCTVYADRGAQSTCCSACGTRCQGCAAFTTRLWVNASSTAHSPFAT